MLSSLKHLGAKAKGLFEHKETDVHEHEVDEIKKSDEVINEASCDENTKSVDASNQAEAEKAAEKAYKKRKERRNRFAYEPHSSFDF